MTLEEIKTMRVELIKKGKRLPNFAQLKYKHPRNEKERQKYCDVDDVDASGAILEHDVEVLYTLVKKYNPKTIIEVGSWFGTSAMVMDKASNGAAIYTCDKNNVYVYESETVKFFNKGSGNFFSKMIKANVRADFMFIDGQIVEDIAKLPKCMAKNCVILFHDYEKPQKGWRNVEALKKISSFKLLVDKENKTALVEMKK